MTEYDIGKLFNLLPVWPKVALTFKITLEHCTCTNCHYVMTSRQELKGLNALSQWKLTSVYDACKLCHLLPVWPKVYFTFKSTWEHRSYTHYVRISRQETKVWDTLHHWKLTGLRQNSTSKTHVTCLLPGPVYTSLISWERGNLRPAP